MIINFCIVLVSRITSLNQVHKAQNTDKWNRTNKGMTSFHWVCLEGFSKIAKLFLDNTVDMAIDLNLKDNTFLWTGFHFACYYGKTSIVDMILTNSKSLNIDLTASDELGKDFSISGWNIDKRNCLFPFISYVFLNNGMIWRKYKLMWQLCAAMVSWVWRWVELVEFLQKIAKSSSKFLLFPFSTFIYLVALNLLVNNQLNSSSNSTHHCGT